MYNNKFKGKTVLVTGAARGIGYGIASAFASEGANLVITDVADVNMSAKKLSEDYNVSVLGVRADGSKESDVKKTIEKTIERFGRIDCVVNNAQASKAGTKLVDHSKEDFDMAIYTGLYATFFYMKEAFPYLKESKGSVINLASGAGIQGEKGQSSYAAAKEGIRGMSRVVANEWGEFGINVNVVCPLAMTTRLEEWKAEYPDLYEQTIRDIPLGRFGDPKDDIGRACVFLASDEASYITGETVSLQGGSGLRA